MDDAEAGARRREILEDVGAILREHLAADAWGRCLVEVVRGEHGEVVVAGIDVEEVIGDEQRVDEVFGGEAARQALPILALAVEALCALDGVDPDEVRGGAFVRLEGDRFAWLPGLVHAPSVPFDRERDALMAKLRAKNAALANRYGFPADGRLEIDLARERASFVRVDGPGMRARATLVGTFAPASRTWGWGGTNPHVPEPVRRASAALADDIPDRDLWELSTPVFASDEPTAWALAALVCDRAGGAGVFCGGEGEGQVFILLRDVRDE